MGKLFCFCNFDEIQLFLNDKVKSSTQGGEGRSMACLESSAGRSLRSREQPLPPEGLSACYEAHLGGGEVSRVDF